MPRRQLTRSTQALSRVLEAVGERIRYPKFSVARMSVSRGVIRRHSSGLVFVGWTTSIHSLPPSSVRQCGVAEVAHLEAGEVRREGVVVVRLGNLWFATGSRGQSVRPI